MQWEPPISHCQCVVSFPGLSAGIIHAAPCLALCDQFIALDKTPEENLAALGRHTTADPKLITTGLQYHILLISRTYGMSLYDYALVVDKLCLIDELILIWANRCS